MGGGGDNEKINSQAAFQPCCRRGPYSPNAGIMEKLGDNENHLSGELPHCSVM